MGNTRRLCTVLKMKHKNSKTRPLPLVPGDEVAIVAPGFGTANENLVRARQFLQDRGYLVKKRKVLGGHFLHAATDDARAEILGEALTDPQVKAIWCLRGGYGSQRLLPALEKLRRPSQAKWLIGMSDITALNAFLWQTWGWPSLHGPVLERLSHPTETVRPRDAKETWELLRGEPGRAALSLRALNPAAKNLQSLKGVALGGNLVTYMALLGTRFWPMGPGQILFFEEIGERGYRIDRLLTQWSQSEVFKGVRAVVFGSVSGGFEPNSASSLFRPVLRRFAEEVKIPIFTGFPFGHTEVQKPWIFGAQAHLRRRQKDRFEVEISL